VHRAEAALDEQTRTIDVVIRVSDPFRRGTSMDGSEGGTADPPPLLIGQFVDVEMNGIEGDYLVVPRRAVRPGNEVWLVEDGLIRIVPVEVLQRNDGQAFIAGGLSAGQRVVVEGIDLATEGMAVQDRGGMS
jgi:multidrug efflux pump subunit AcrA (membrane-fusion protein)